MKSFAEEISETEFEIGIVETTFKVKPCMLIPPGFVDPSAFTVKVTQSVAVHPSGKATVTQAVYVPTDVYCHVGNIVVEVFPSPKLQMQFAAAAFIPGK
jgi:hypothetical protein